MIDVSRALPSGFVIETGVDHVFLNYSAFDACKNVYLGWLEWLRTHTVLAEGWSSVSSTYMVAIISYNFGFSRFHALFWTPWAFALTCPRIDTGIHIIKHDKLNTKMYLKFKTTMTPLLHFSPFGQENVLDN